jgi:hypothetical protein
MQLLDGEEDLLLRDNPTKLLQLARTSLERMNAKQRTLEEVKHAEKK